MISLNHIFDEIICDFTKNEYLNQIILSRIFRFDNGVVFMVYYNNQSQTREVAVKIPDNFDELIINKYPKWKGLDLLICQLNEGRDKGFYLLFKQLREYDPNIFIIILEDLLNELNRIKITDSILIIIGKVLGKWRQFFQMHYNVIMSEVMQQALYGELLFLNKMIDKYGERAINLWSGFNRETHDFYIQGDAVEVKTTSSNSANCAIINNEYQLDANDVACKLYLMFIALRKSVSDGEKLPELIEKISNKLVTTEYTDIFKEKLFKYGYIYSLSEAYSIGFHKRDIRYYQILSDFPRIDKSALPNFVSDVEYTLNLDGCKQYLIDENLLLMRLRE